MRVLDMKTIVLLCFFPWQGRRSTLVTIQISTQLLEKYVNLLSFI